MPPVGPAAPQGAAGDARPTQSPAQCTRQRERAKISPCKISKIALYEEEPHPKRRLAVAGTATWIGFHVALVGLGTVDLQLYSVVYGSIVQVYQAAGEPVAAAMTADAGLPGVSRHLMAILLPVAFGAAAGVFGFLPRHRQRRRRNERRPRPRSGSAQRGGPVGPVRDPHERPAGREHPAADAVLPAAACALRSGRGGRRGRGRLPRTCSRCRRWSRCGSPACTPTWAATIRNAASPTFRFIGCSKRPSRRGWRSTDPA